MKSYLKKLQIKANPILEMNTTAIPVQMEDDMEHDESEENDSISSLLQMALLGEYQQWDLYVAYASRLKGLARNSVADEFKAHADEEEGHIDLIQRYLVSMGVTPTLQRHTIPEMPEDASMQNIIQLQLKFERDAVELYKKILTALDDNDPLRIDIENVMVKEQEHVHDLELLLKDNVTAGLMFKPKEAGEDVKPQAGYGCGCNCSCPNCSCSKPASFILRVDNAWCTKALKELTPDIYARWYQGKLLSAQEKEFIAYAIAMKWGLKDKRAMQRFLDGMRA